MILNPTSNKKSFTKKQLIALISGFVLMLLSGLVNGWSIFVEPIEQDLHLLRQDTALVFTISLSVSIGGQMLAGFLNQKVQSRFIYWLVALFSFIGFLGSSASNGLWGIYICYGVFSGLAIGMIYNLVLTGVSALFSTGTSLVSGILLMGFGIGPLILGMGASLLIERTGWRATFGILAAVYVILLFLASFLIPTRKSTDKTVAESTKDISTAKMLHSHMYWWFFSLCAMMGSASLILIGHSSLIVRDMGISFGAASVMTGVISVSCGISRVFFGRYVDLHGNNALKSILVFCTVLGSIVSLFGYMFNSLPLLCLGYIVTGAANGGSAVYICAFVQERYGTAHYGMNMAFTNIYMIIGSFCGTALAGVIKTKTGSYGMALIIMTVFALLGIICSMQITRCMKNRKA